MKQTSIEDTKNMNHSESYEQALQWKREQEAQGIFVTDEDFQQTLNAITYETQHRHDYDEPDNFSTTGE